MSAVTLTMSESPKRRQGQRCSQDLRLFLVWGQMLSIHVRRTILVAAEKAIQPPWADFKPYSETIRLGDARIVWHLALTCECLQQKPVQDQPRPDDRVQQAGRSGSAGSAAASREEPPRWTSRARGLARPTQKPCSAARRPVFAASQGQDLRRPSSCASRSVHVPSGACTSWPTDE